MQVWRVVFLHAACFDTAEAEATPGADMLDGVGKLCKVVDGCYTWGGPRHQSKAFQNESRHAG